MTLCTFGGRRELTGLNNLTMGDLSDANKAAALERARTAGFKGA